MNQTPTTLNKLDLQLRDYLLQHTNHALLLTAGWGAGKTYYLKNHFFKGIQDTGYEPVLVSLFGIKSIDDIKDKIITELYPFLENKYLKASKTILKTVLKSADVTKLFGDGILASMVDQASVAKKELKGQHRDQLNLEKLLICFDDLERASPDLLTGSEILGFINSLVEGNNIKVIIVANEGVLNDDKYLEVKEKTIGETIHFHQDFNDTFLSILEAAPQTVAYKQFLKQNQEIIQRFLSIDKNHEQAKVNYRTLTHFIARFSQVYQFVDNGLETPALLQNKTEMLTNQLKFSLFVVNEYKKGFFTFKDRKGFDDGVSLMIKRYMSYRNKEPEVKSLLLKIADAYFPNEDLNFYHALYDYLTGGDFFDKVKLLVELKQQYHIIDDVISASYQVYNKLASTDYQQYSDSTFKELTREMKHYALSGDYQLHDYVSVFYYVFRHGNVLGLNEDEFLSKLLIQIRKKKSSHVYNPLIDKYISVSEDGEFYRWSVKLREEILRVNSRAGLTGRSAIVRQMEHDLVHDYTVLHLRLIKEVNTPFGIASFSGISAGKFAAQFQKASNDKKSMMLDLLRILYMPRQGNNSAGDLEFLRSLGMLLKAHQQRFQARNISGYLRAELIKTVETAIVEIIPYQPIVNTVGEG